ncbi:MAG: hypothetical protein R2788_17570 [Saprospiraceae bacterium]
MKAIAGNKYDFGFAIDETEIRRLVSIIKEQLLKIDPSSTIVEDYRIIYKNGTIAENITLDEILREENYGSGMITNLSISLKFLEKEPNIESDVIKLNFNNLDESPLDSHSHSITYNVIGNSRDWVFTTSSLLHERINKVKRKNTLINNIRNPDSKLNGYTLFLIIGLCLWFIPREPSLDDYSIENPVTEKSNLLNELEKLADSNDFKNPIEAVIQMKILEEKIKNDSILTSTKWREERRAWHEQEVTKFNNTVWSKIPTWLSIIGALILPYLLMYSIHSAVRKYYIEYYFLWGDQVELFQKNNKIIGYILNTIIVGILISFLGGVLANLL